MEEILDTARAQNKSLVQIKIFVNRSGRISPTIMIRIMSRKNIWGFLLVAGADNLVRVKVLVSQYAVGETMINASGSREDEGRTSDRYR